MLKKLLDSSAFHSFMVLVVGLGIAGFIIQKIARRDSTVRAFGSILVDFGVPSGDPIFTFDDFKPGDCAEHDIFVTNNTDSETVLVKMKTIDTSNPDALSDALSVVINDGTEDVYGGTLGDKSMTDLFTDSAAGVALSTLSGGESVTYTIKICFDIDAGNEYQKTTLVFDIIFETGRPPIELPPECAHLAGIITKVVEGTPGNDRIHGSIANELILAYEGDDRIDPSSGSDCIVAGPGNDRVQGTTGNDVVIGGPGNDRLEGGTDDDYIYDYEGNNKIKGGSGNDHIWAGSGNDDIDGGSGSDVIYAGGGNDEVEGGSGDDKLYGEAGNDKLEGETHNDKLYGGDGNDTMKGGSGNDELYGEAGNDSANGNSGTDACVAEILDSCEL